MDIDLSLFQTFLTLYLYTNLQFGIINNLINPNLYCVFS